MKIFDFGNKLELAGAEMSLRFDAPTKAASIRLAKGLVMLVVASAGILFSAVAHAQNSVLEPYEAAAAYNAYNANFLANPTSNYPYYTTELLSVGNNPSGDWIDALDIETAEENFQNTHSPAAQLLVYNLLNQFLNQNGSNWYTGSAGGWNDNVEWDINAFTRGYEVTGNTGFLNDAENQWYDMWNDQLDTAGGGGIWENESDMTRNTLSNNPFIWEGVELYKATGNATFLNDAETDYAWVRANLFNSTNSNNALGAPGQVNGAVLANNQLQEQSGNVYDSGSFLQAAVELYQVTGNSEYYNDAVLDISYVMNTSPICYSGGEAPGSQWAYRFFHALSLFCTYNNLWPTYYPYFLANANQAWQERSSSNLTWNDWLDPTNPNSPPTDAMEMTSGASIWQELNVPQLYQIVNENSGLAMDLIGGSQANNAPIQQWAATNGDANQMWEMIPTPDGNYSIISGETAMATTISAASKQQNATVVDWPYGVGNTSLEYKLNNEGNGWYEIQNVNSGLVLDDSGGGTTNGTPIIQWPSSGQTNQNWKFVPVSSFGGRYEIQNASTGNVLNVTGASTTPGAAVIQWPYNGATNELWTFVPTSMGYFEIVNVNSGQQLNVNDNSFFNGADICQWPGGNEASDQWYPAQNSNGTWTFYNLNSGLALDDDASSSQGTQFVQWQESGNNNQEYNLISR